MLNVLEKINFNSIQFNWVHIKCNGIPIREYNMMMEDNAWASEIEINNST